MNECLTTTKHKNQIGYWVWESEMYLHGRASAHGTIGCLINPSWWAC